MPLGIPASPDYNSCGVPRKWLLGRSKLARHLPHGFLTLPLQGVPLSKLARRQRRLENRHVSRLHSRFSLRRRWLLESQYRFLPRKRSPEQCNLSISRSSHNEYRPSRHDAACSKYSIRSVSATSTPWRRFTPGTDRTRSRLRLAIPSTAPSGSRSIRSVHSRLCADSVFVNIAFRD